jgi:hypothetical protein
MARKPKRKLTTAEKAAKARQKAQFMTIFLNGRQKKVRRPEYIEGQSAHDFIRSKADPLWLHQNEMWELIADPEPDEARLASPDDELFWA